MSAVAVRCNSKLSVVVHLLGERMLAVLTLPRCGERELLNGFRPPSPVTTGNAVDAADSAEVAGTSASINAAASVTAVASVAAAATAEALLIASIDCFVTTIFFS